MQPYGLPAGTTISRGVPWPDRWVDQLCRQWGIDSSTYGGHQEGDRRDIGSAPNPQNLNRGIDWWGEPQKLLDFARWLVSIAPNRNPGEYGPAGIEMIIYQDPRTGEQVWYPRWVDFSGDLPQHTDHVHTRFSASIDVAPPTVMTVPLTMNPDGTWTSPSPAWAHLIMRESGGDPAIVQQIIDVNSGGNEAEGLFQITPATWRTHKGDEFAPSPRLATPQQQAIVAARIFVANPSGSDWGAGLPGREDPSELAAGLVPLVPEPQPEPGDDMSGVNTDRLNAAVDKILASHPSRSMFAADANSVDDTLGILWNSDGNLWNLEMILGVLLGVPYCVQQVKRMSRNDFPAGTRVAADPWLRKLAVDFATKLVPLEGVLASGVPGPTPPPGPPPTPTPTPQPTGPKPVAYCVNGFGGDMWTGLPADVGHGIEDKFWFQPVGYTSGAFPLGIGRDSGVAELRRLISEHQAKDPGRRFVLVGFSLGAVIVDDVFDMLRSGELQRFWPYFLGGVKFGDPRREAGVAWDGPRRCPPGVPPGVGIAGSGNLKNTPDNFRSYVYPQNWGDIYTNSGMTPSGVFDAGVAADCQLVYDMIMLNWDGTLTGLLMEATELITKCGEAGLDIIMSCFNGLQFLTQQQAPHMSYPVTDAVAFLRSLV